MKKTIKLKCMKKTSLLFIGILLSMSNLFSQFVPPYGEDTISGVWKTGSTIKLFNSFVIPPGESLTIEPGVTIIICDTGGNFTTANPTGNQIEIDALGDFYCLGTAAQPITIKVADSLINYASFGPYGSYWNSIFTDTSCHEFIMTYTNISNTGAATTSTSFSVQMGLYKAKAGKTVPPIDYMGGNGQDGGLIPNGKLVVENCSIHNTSDDAIYVQGGNFIIANNIVYTEGQAGGDGFDIKSGSWGDICSNLSYSAYSNAFKLANTQGYNPTIDVVAYNNTIVNAGWRDNTVEGGSIYLQEGAISHIYNNMLVDCRYGLKVEVGDGPDLSSVWDYQYYFGQSQVCVNQFQPYDSTSSEGTPDVVGGPHDVRGTLAFQNDPLFINYPFSSSEVVDTGTTVVGFFLNSTYDTSWNFHLQANSPAKGKGTLNITPHWSVTGITFTENGGHGTFKSLLPSTTPGAFGAVTLTGITVSPSKATVKITDSTALTATVSPKNGENYVWTSSNNTIATVDSLGTVKALKAGTASIYATTVDNSFKDSSVITVPSATIIPSAIEYGLTIFPNPVKTDLQIQFDASSDVTGITVTSALGQVLISENSSNNLGEITISIPVDNLPKGLYFINVKNGDLNASKKFVKQ